MVQHHTKWCTADTLLITLKQCSSAKAVLDPSAPAVKSENNKGAPKGCSRHKGEWFFNTHEEGSLDGISEPICKAATGIKNELSYQKTC